MHSTLDVSRDVSDDDTLDDLPVAPAPPLSRRGFGKHLFLGASALAVLFAARQPEEAQAAPLTDTWKLGGNTGVTTDGTNFLGTTNVAPLIFKTAPTAGRPAERMRIMPTGNIGIGTSSPGAKLHVVSTTYAVFGRHSVTTGSQPGVYGDTFATVADASGVMGLVRSTTPGAESAGVRGTNNGTNANGAGVRGSHAGSGLGVHGSSASGTGVHGTGYTGVWAKGSTYGVYASGIYGVYGSGTYGVYGAGTTSGVYAVSNSGTGLRASSISGYGVSGSSNSGYGVYGHSSSGIGVYGESSASNQAGVFAASPYIGLQANATGADGGRQAVRGENYGSSTGYAGFFNGNVWVYGTLIKNAGSFRIDHPLDPENKYLSHSFVESPDMMNVYNGNATMDAKGEATVELPNYFEALNRDFRYQLTTIGSYAPVYIAEEIKGNRFKIAGGKPGTKVSWQVTGIRQDTFANANRIRVEEDKPNAMRGRYVYPQGHGEAPEQGIGAMLGVVSLAEQPNREPPDVPQAPQP